MIINDFNSFTYIRFAKVYKEEMFKSFIRFTKLVQNQLNLKIIPLRSEHGGEFVNHHFEEFCKENGVTHNFPCLCNAKQNGVV